MLYRDIWENISPLAGLVYWGIDSLFGRSQLAYQLLAVLISLFQVLYFNYSCNIRDIFPEKTLIPGLIYALLLNISFDMATLSPMLMATTFLLLAIGTITRMISKPDMTDEVFEAGLYIGIATLFYLPASLFYGWAFLSLLLYTGATFRHHLLGFFGSCFPLLMVALIFFLNNALESLNRNLLTTTFQAGSLSTAALFPFLKYMLIPLSLGAAGFYKLFFYTRFTHFQTRVQQIMTMWFILAAFTIPLMDDFSPMYFLISLPAIAYFVSWYFMSFRKKIAGELIFLGYLFYTLFFFYQEVYRLVPGSTMGQLDHLLAKPALLPAEITGKKILVLGEDEGEYINNYAATPYLNWSLSVYDFRSLDNFDSVIHVYNNFRKDPPEYIIDKENIMPKLFERIPQLQEHYQPTPWKSIYRQNSQLPFTELHPAEL